VGSDGGVRLSGETIDIEMVEIVKLSAVEVEFANGASVDDCFKMVSNFTKLSSLKLPLPLGCFESHLRYHKPWSWPCMLAQVL
jgi:hypothetical protein